MTPTVVKVGGSLFDWPSLPRALDAWLQLLTPQVLFVAGGGELADVVRQYDERFQLGNEAAHWLAIETMSLNARLLAAILPRATVVTGWADCPALWQARRIPILDARPFFRADAHHANTPPPSWDVTSDSLALRVAELGHTNVVLLKSADLPAGSSWHDAVTQRFVDAHFAARPFSGTITALNLRGWWAAQQLGEFADAAGVDRPVPPAVADAATHGEPRGFERE